VGREGLEGGTYAEAGDEDGEVFVCGRRGGWGAVRAHSFGFYVLVVSCVGLDGLWDEGCRGDGEGKKGVGESDGDKMSSVRGASQWSWCQRTIVVYGGAKCVIYGCYLIQSGWRLWGVVGCGVRPLLQFGLFDPESLYFNLTRPIRQWFKHHSLTVKGVGKDGYPEIEQ